MSEAWLTSGAAELGRGIAAGQIDPVALAETFLTAAGANPLTPRIYARLTPERALAEARAASTRAKAGQRLGPLDGVPLSWKDLFDSAGTATEAGSALLRGRVPRQDATVLRRASLAGSVCLGKTHMSELAFSGLGLNPVTATPPCVNDMQAVSGGSSSGAAASVAFGLAPAAIGSDTGGSVRIPAAWNDLVGLKTTWGRLPLDGVVPLVAPLDTVGPLTRCVEDAALLLGLLEGGPPPDLRGARLHGTRLMSLRSAVLDDCEAAPRDAFTSAVDRLRNAGAEVTYADCPTATEVLDLPPVLMTAVAWATWRTRIEADPEAMFAPIRARFENGADWSAVDYLQARAALDGLRADWAAATAGYDAVIAPTVAILPPEVEPLLADSQHYAQCNLMALRNTRLGNLLGLCALTLPTGIPSCGVMLMAPPGGDRNLLRLGAAAEAALA